MLSSERGFGSKFYSPPRMTGAGACFPLHGQGPDWKPPDFTSALRGLCRPLSREERQHALGWLAAECEAAGTGMKSSKGVVLNLQVRGER